MPFLSVSTKKTKLKKSRASFFLFLQYQGYDKTRQHTNDKQGGDTNRDTERRHNRQAGR